MSINLLPKPCRFDGLYHQFVTHTCKRFEVPPSEVPISEFLDEAVAMINSRLQDGLEPRAQDLYIVEHALAHNL